MIIVHCQADLLEIIHCLRAAGGGARLLNRRQQHGKHFGSLFSCQRRLKQNLVIVLCDGERIEKRIGQVDARQHHGAVFALDAAGGLACPGERVLGERHSGRESAFDLLRILFRSCQELA